MKLSMQFMVGTATIFIISVIIIIVNFIIIIITIIIIMFNIWSFFRACVFIWEGNKLEGKKSETELTASVLKKRSKTHKRLKEHFLIIRNRTKRANFRCNHLFRDTYNTCVCVCLYIVYVCVYISSQCQDLRTMLGLE